jgi:class 3 adenylate cyclase
MGRSETNLTDSAVPETVESDLPTGTVTFLLTDIEGSTKLWEAGADETALSVARHYELLDAAISLPSINDSPLQLRLGDFSSYG